MNPFDLLSKHLGNPIANEIDYYTGFNDKQRSIRDELDQYNAWYNKPLNMGPMLGKATITPRPDWQHNVAQARSTDGYQDYIKNNSGFTLGGKNYVWKEAPADLTPEFMAERIVNQSHRGDKQYMGSYANLINQRRQLTGKNYVPVLAP